jgi:hypothetical protein
LRCPPTTSTPSSTYFFAFNIFISIVVIIEVGVDGEEVVELEAAVVVVVAVGQVVVVVVAVGQVVVATIPSP